MKKILLLLLLLPLSLLAQVTDDFSDGVFLPVPVQKPVQTLTEAHSAVLRAGMSRETLLAELRDRVVHK